MKSREQQFREERLTGIGASDAAAALGVSKWQTPLQLYFEKRGELVDERQPEEEWQTWGKRLEPVVLSAFAMRHEGEVVETNPDAGKMLRSVAYPWMIAHPDAQIPGRAVVQAKTSRTAFGWGEDGSGDAPIDYVVQVHHEMIVTGLRLAYIPVLIAGCEYREIVVPYDHELAEMVVTGTDHLWYRIIEGRPPPPRTIADVNRLFATARSGSVAFASPAALDLIKQLRTARGIEKQFKEEGEDLERQIKEFMQDNETLAFEGNTLITWKQQTTRRLDIDALKKADPETFDAYAKETVSRRFLLKDK